MSILQPRSLLGLLPTVMSLSSPPAWLAPVGWAGLAAAGCSASPDQPPSSAADDDDSADGTTGHASDGGPDQGSSGDPRGGSGASSGGAQDDEAVVLLVRTCGPDTCQSYLQAYRSVDDMVDAEVVDRSLSVEVEYSQGRVFGDGIYLFSRDTPTITRWTVEDDLSLSQGETVSFANTGTEVFCQICNVFASPQLAFHLDAITGGVAVAWNPSTMEIRNVLDIPETIVGRLAGATAEVVFPTLVDGRAFYSASWSNFDSLEVHERAALVAFETRDDAPSFELIEDDRCGGTYVMTPFSDDEGNVYAMGEWYAGYYQAGIPERVSSPACLLRVAPGAREFDPDFEIDLLAATDAQAIRNAFPMSDGRILLNVLPVDAPPVAQDAFEEDPFAYYSRLDFEYVVFDIASRDVLRVEALDPAGGGNATPLLLDGRNFLQVYPEGRAAGAHLYEIDTDATASKVIEASTNSDFSMIGRVR